jgi:hypothetical protein
VLYQAEPRPDEEGTRSNAFAADGVQLKDFTTRRLFWSGLNEIFVVQFGLRSRMIEPEMLHSA